MEGRRSQVILLDERKLEIQIQPKLYAGDLLAIVASHFNLKEKEYFGLAFLDDDGHYSWLHLDHYVLDHEFPKKSNGSQLTLYFLVKYYVESVTLLKDSVTFEQFYLQTKALVAKGQIEAETEVIFELAAYALQVTYGDFTSESLTASNLKKLSVLPVSITNDKSLQWEEKVVDFYKKLKGLPRGLCIVNFLTIVEKLPTYGVHFYDVKDKSGYRLCLGLSHKGIAVYDSSSKKSPKKVYHWKQLENLYFRDRKFSIEVHDTKRVCHALSSLNLYEEVADLDELGDAIADPPSTQVSSSRRRSFGPGNVVVVVWFAANSSLTKSIWSMAISQHQFHLDKKQSKSSLGCESKLNDIAAELSVSKSSLSLSGSNVSRCASSQSLDSGQQSQLNGSSGGGQTAEEMTEQTEQEKAARREILAALRAKKEALEMKLREKTEELMKLCVKEGGIIGELPLDTPLVPGEPKPQVRRRMGTSFTFPENLINKLKSKEGEELADLELEFEIQSKIASAALRLANDAGAKRSVRKQRIICYKQSQAKLKSLELRLAAARSVLNQKRGQIKKKQPRPSVTSADDADFLSLIDGVSLSPATTPLTPSTPSSSKSSKISDAHDESNVQAASDRQLLSDLPRSLGSSCTSISRSSPSTPTSDSRLIIQAGSRNISPSRFSAGGYIPNSVYQTRSSYRNQHYPTFSTKSKSQSDFDKLSNRSSSVSGKFSPAFHSKCDGPLLIESRGLYNVPMQRTSQAFFSQDELDELRDGQNQDRPSSRRSSRFQPSPQNYFGSLDRAFSCSASYTGKIESRSMDNLDFPDGVDAEEVFEAEPAVGVADIVEETELFKSPYPLQVPPENLFPILRYDCSPRRGPVGVPRPVEASPQLMRNSVARWQPQSSNNDYELDCAVRPVMNFAPHSLLRTVEHPVNHLSQKHTISMMSVNSIAVTGSGAGPGLGAGTGREFGAGPLSSPGSGSVSGTMSVNLSPKAKEKEWYESCVDSPLPPRKPSLSSFCDPVTPPTTPSVSAVSPLKAPASMASPAGSSEHEGSFLTVPFQSPRNCTVVSVGQFQPYREETKPYETADFFKYSTKFRKQQQAQSPNEINTSGPAASRVAQLTIDTHTTKSSSDLHRIRENPSHLFRNSSFQYSHTAGDCIGPDEAYNSRFEMPFLPSPKTMGSPRTMLQGVYDPPKAMTCEPLLREQGHIRSPLPSPQLIRTNSLIKSRDNSFTMDKSSSLADAFHEEMLAWYEDQDNCQLNNQATLV